MTGNPELALAETVNGASPNVFPGNVLKVIVCATQGPVSVPESSTTYDLYTPSAKSWIVRLVTIFPLDVNTARPGVPKLLMSR